MTHSFPTRRSSDLVEPAGEREALIAQVALDLEIGVEAEGLCLPVLQAAAELGGKALFREIRDVRGHAGDGEALLGTLAMPIVIAIAPFRIGHDRLAADLMERDVLGRVARGRSEHPRDRKRTRMNSSH